MNWMEIAIAALSGAIAAAVAQLVVGFKHERKGLFTVVLLILFFVLRFSARSYLEPQLRVWEAERQIEEIPFYKTLSIHDPATYQRVRVAIRESVLAGDSRDKIESRLGKVISDVLPRYLPKASDDSVVDFENSLVRLLDELNHANPDACYAALFPNQFGEPGLVQKYATRKTQEDFLAAMNEVVESAITRPQGPPNSKKSEELLQPIKTSLAKDYGSDLKLLLNTAQNSSERKKVCEITSDMYRQIGSLPRADAGEALRYLLSSKN
jgi:hypothetical protein